MSRPIVFVDTETTALGRSARPWEIAVIRRGPGGEERTLLAQVSYPLNGLPEGTSPEALDVGGWLRRGVEGSRYAHELRDDDVRVVRDSNEQEIARVAHSYFSDKPVLVGVGVHFDAAILSALFRRHRFVEEPWHYALVDLKAVTWGWIRAMRTAAPDDWPGTAEAALLPMSSEVLSLAAGVEPPAGAERHTALGDARWAARWFDRLVGGES